MSIESEEPFNFDNFLKSIRIFAFEKAAELNDVSHDRYHIDRIVKNALTISKTEEADLAIVMPAAYLHDCVNFEKNDPRRKESSKHAADAAVDFLASIQYPEKYFKDISHAIHAHSFSANVATQSLEAKIVQDADRLDALGVIGFARMISVSTRLGRPFYQPNDPLCRSRKPDDQKWALDHFFVKLVKVAENLNTESAKVEGRKRLESMAVLLGDWERELHWNS